MIAALSFIIAFAVVNVAVAWPIVARLDSGNALSGPERAAIAFGIGTIGLYLLVFAVGPWRLDAVSMGAVAAAWTVVAIPGMRSLARESRRLRVAAGLAALKANRGETLLWVLLAGVALSSVLQGMAPVNDYDSLMYHMAIPQLDVERGHIAPAWDRGLPHAFFPALAGHLYRLTLALMGDRPVQMITGLYGVMIAVLTAALVVRMGWGRMTALLAALLVLSVRVVVWEMASPEVEIILTAYGCAALVLLLAWVETPRRGLMLLLGVMLAGTVLSKLTGLAVTVAIALPLAGALLRRPAAIGQVAAAAAVSLLLLAPHLISMAVLTGNPVFPLLNPVFAPHLVNFFAELRGQYGIGRGPLEMLIAPWFLSTRPMQHFDGMVLGAPVLLALLPLTLLAIGRMRHAVAVGTVCVVYYLLWFHLLSQQVRFLMPIFPMLSAFCAIGANAAWRLAATSGWARAGLAACFLVLAVNQGMFVGIYTSLRLPVAFGLVSAERYFTDTPTMNGAHYIPCRWLRDHMAPHDRLLSLLSPHSYHCPQAAATVRFFPDEERRWLTEEHLPNLSRAEFVRRFREGNFRYVIVPTFYEHRRTESGKPARAAVDFGEQRFGAVAEFLDGLTPLAADDRSAVYDGRAIRARIDESEGRR
ncbi:MAG: hypothetical protein HQL42_02420 [Alphaproteobacteria bacterium]|nr:hypothetical protein [Alphaproteobacteria bacterium]